LQYGYDNTLPFFPHGIASSAATPSDHHSSVAPVSAVSTSAETLTDKFKQLYAVAQTPSMQKRISDILARRDMADPEKVESIANMLRSAANAEH
jgi:hypothetical protein